MPISFTCPHCGMPTEVADEFAGQSGPCAHCGRRVAVPALTSPTAVVVAAESRSVRTSKWLIGILVAVAGLAMMCLCLFTAVPYFGFNLQSAEKLAQASQAKGNVKQITDALLRYHTDHGEFPPAYTVDAKGQPLHSWRTLILPYLGEEPLYSQIRLNEAWNSPFNTQFHNRMPKIFADPSDPAAPAGNLTSYVAIEGVGFVFDGSKKTKLQQLTDGPSDTILVIEDNNSDVIWMEPRDLPGKTMDFSIGSKVPAVASGHSDGGYVGLADGNVKFIKPGMDAAEFKGLLTTSGNEPKQVW